MTTVISETPVASPPVIPEAFSSTFRSGRTRSRVAIAALAAIAVGYSVWAWVEIMGLALIDRAELGLVTESEWLEYDAMVLALAGALLLASLVCAIAFLAWLSRTVDNIPVLTGRVPSTTPRWSIGWWFIPFANFFKPYQVVKEASIHLAGSTGRAGAGLILIWWIAFIVGSIVSIVVSRMPIGTADDYRTFLTIGVLVDALEVGAAILAIVVILRIQSSADTLAATATTSPTVAPLVTSPSQPAAPSSAPVDATLHATLLVPDINRCPRCGAPSEPGVPNCRACGLDLWAAYDQQPPVSSQPE